MGRSEVPFSLAELKAAHGAKFWSPVAWGVVRDGKKVLGPEATIGKMRGLKFKVLVDGDERYLSVHPYVAANIDAIVKIAKSLQKACGMDWEEWHRCCMTPTGIAKIKKRLRILAKRWYKTQ